MRDAEDKREVDREREREREIRREIKKRNVRVMEIWRRAVDNKRCMGFEWKERELERAQEEK